MTVKIVRNDFEEDIDNFETFTYFSKNDVLPISDC